MKIDPNHTTIGRLFGDDYIFHVPKYQRNFAWTETEIGDFINDLNKCIDSRHLGNTRSHFFGGILSISTGPPTRRECDLVDGQQRLATFIMLVANIISTYKSLLKEIENLEDNESTEILSIRIKNLTQKYIKFRREINREITTIDRIELSGPDKQYFKNLISGLPQATPSTYRESFKRLNQSFTKINNFLTTLIEPLQSIGEKLDLLKLMEDILDEDFTVLHMVTQSKKDAYRLFQVLNDRGIGLTVGDLLRSRTLEMLEGEDYQDQQEQIQATWNDILFDHPSQTEDFLQWHYSSIRGSRLNKASLLDDFLDAFFPNHNNENDGRANSIEEANDIVEKINRLHSEIALCRMLVEGNWPVKDSRPITQWHKDRLRLLTVELKHTNCMPLLLAACSLDRKIFAEIVELTQRFIFRYKIICNRHISSVTRVYLDHSQAIRSNPTSYQVQSLQSDFRELQEERAPNDLFRSNLNELTYQLGGGNKPLKYFLMTLEHYARWYRNGANGEAECLDKTIVFDFGNTTIEHIYPQHPENPVADLDEMVDDLGNLTFLGPGDNVIGGNMSYLEKRQIFLDSSVTLNSIDIGKKDKWELDEITTHKKHLIDMALKVFSV